MQDVSERLRLLLPDEILTVFIEKLAFKQFTSVQVLTSVLGFRVFFLIHLRNSAALLLYT